MSADNGIYILETPKGKTRGKKFEYRVAYQMGVEDYKWDKRKNDYTENPRVQIKNARRMWKKCKVYTNEGDALDEANKMYKEFLDGDNYGILEYGICFININAEF